MLWAWVGIMILWYLSAFVGLVLSIAGVRTALRVRSADPPWISRQGATRMVRLALTRLVIFSFLFVNAPIVFWMFQVTPETQLTEIVPGALPFWLIALAGIIVATASTLIVIFTVLDLRDVLRR